ncbi:MAG: response regulator transcription factor [Thermoleophilaceae bacterium]|nr:response regulator transcription factor [Thermoleophilaceae bacterium]
MDRTQEVVGSSPTSSTDPHGGRTAGKPKTNRQIAEELFLSEKTVATHLSHIFEKLGVSSRAEAAAVVERERAGTVG